MKNLWRGKSVGCRSIVLTSFGCLINLGAMSSLYALDRQTSGASESETSNSETSHIGILKPEVQKNEAGTFGIESCTSQEKWNWLSNESIKSTWIHEFESFLKKNGSQGSIIRSFSEALALRKMSESNRERAFSEYWISRTLYSTGLIHLAEKGFTALLQRESDVNIAPFQLAALGCLAAIHRKVLGIEIDKSLLPTVSKLKALIPSLTKESSSQSTRKLFRPVWEAAFYLLVNNSKHANDILALLENSGPFEALGLAVVHSSQERFEEVRKDLDRFFSYRHPSRGIENKENHLAEKDDLWRKEIFEPFINRAHLLYGRASYSVGNYNDAIAHYQLIETHSNEWVHGLSELSWAFLMAEKYREAIGTAIGLQSGALRKTFAPEAMMVMSMSLNEMCRFPESMSVIQSFRRLYRESFLWLDQWKSSGQNSKENFYHSAVEVTKRNPEVKIPQPVASEWIRSSVFISNQDRINFIFKEKDLTALMSRQGKSVQNEMTSKLLTKARNVLRKMRMEKIRARNGDGLSNGLLSELEDLKQDLIFLRHVKNAAPVWRKILESYQSRVPKIQKDMVAGINGEIVRLNQRMYSMLEEIAENNELIEVEILNGASEDIIWQNAHPGYKEAALKMKQTGGHGQADKVWHWGTTQGGLEGRGEIWEDELGSLRADLYDNCESKDRYLSVGGGSS